MFGGASGGGRFVAYDVMLLATMIAVGLGFAVSSPAKSVPRNLFFFLFRACSLVFLFLSSS